MERPVGLEPASSADLDRLGTWLSPPALPDELLEFYRWGGGGDGGGGDLALPPGGPGGGFLAPAAGADQFLDLYATSLETPWPRCLVPVYMLDRGIGAAEIVPDEATCAIWGFIVEDGVFERLYPSVADMIDAIQDMTPYTNAMAERGDEVLAPHVAAAHHPELFELGPDPSSQPHLVRARTTRGLTSPVPEGAEAELLEPWPEHWLAGR